MTPDYLAHLRENSARFAAVLRDAPAGAQVPTCPDWRTDDLLWHLGEVQWFWGTIVREDVTDPDRMERPERPGSREELLAFFGASTTALESALAETDPAERRWTWSEDDQTAGFTRRRQAHEALIHRIDAELTADIERAPMDPALASDGVDEALRIMFGGWPSWASIEPDPSATVRVRASDTGTSWHVTLGVLSGTSPEGKEYVEPAVQVAPHDNGRHVEATVEGNAADLDCWLWGRPTVGSLNRRGDETVLARLQQVVSQGVD